LTGIFAVQDEIGKEVVQALKVKLLAGSAPQRARTTSDEAYLEYLRGKQLVRSDAPMSLAIAAYEKAIAIDPGYAPAWAELATRTAFALGHEPAGSSRAREKALAAAEKAVALAPDLAEPYEARGLVRMFILWDWEGARADIERALTLAPGSNDAWRRQSQLLLVLGRTAEAAAAIRKAIELDPLGWGNWQWLGQVQFSRGEFASARAALERAMELDSSEQGRRAYAESIAGCYLYQGDLAQARSWSEKLPSEDDRIPFKVAIEFSRGEAERSKKDLDALVTRSGAGHPYLVALLHAWRGERDLALEWLGKAYAAPHADLPLLKTDPAFRTLRAEPRFAALLKNMNLPPD
jgi:serine/threonine-protein kinase